MMAILVMKTNISAAYLPQLTAHFDEIPTIQKWTIDFDNCDNVLRIESYSEDLQPIIMAKMNALGFLCEDLS
jgi:hypothetical protein